MFRAILHLNSRNKQQKGTLAKGECRWQLRAAWYPKDWQHQLTFTVWIRPGSHQAPGAPLLSQPSSRYCRPLVSAYYLNRALIMLTWREKGNVQIFNSLTNHFPKSPFTVHHSDTPYVPGGDSEQANGRAHCQQQAGDAVSDRSCRVELHSWGAWVR